MRYNDIVGSLQNLTKREIKQIELAKATGITRATMNYRKNYNIEFSYDDVRKIEQYFNVEFEGQGGKDAITMDYYPDVFGSCGTGAFALSENKEKIKVPQKALATKLSPVKKYSVINARGNSMQPSICDNDKLIVEHYEGEQIIDNRIYVFCYGNEIFIKRLVKNINQLVIISDNTEYDTIKLTGKEFDKVQIIGQIVGLMRDLR